MHAIFKIFKILFTKPELLSPCITCIKILFTPKGGRFCKENFLRYLDLCYVKPA